MALQRQLVPINFGQGLDQKTDSKHVAIGRLTTLENAVFRKKNRLDKRYGHRKISRLATDGTELPNGDGIAVFGNELLQYANQTLYSYAEGIDRWVSKGSAVSAIVRSSQVIKNTAEQTQADSATNNGVTVYAWEDSRGGVRAQVMDEETGAILLADTVLDASASRTRCVAFKSYLFVFYYKSGALYVRRLNPRAPTSFDAAVTVSSTVNTTTPNYDVYAYDDLRILWAHNVQGAAEIKAGWLNDTPAVLSGTLATATIASEAATNCLGIVKGPAQQFFVAWHNVTGVRAMVVNNGLGEVVAPFTVEATAANAINVTGYKQTDNGGITLLYQVTAAATYNHYIRHVDIASDGTVGTPATFLRSVGLYTKAWTYEDSDGNENHYVGVVHDSTLQATFFVARHDGLLVAKQQATFAGGQTTRPILANVWSADTAVYGYALINKGELVSENATLFTPKGVAKTTLDFTNQDIFTAAQLGQNLHIVGGVLGMYDGQSVVEHGFHLYPENVTVTPATSGGSLADGSYSVVVLYEWTDAKGQLHRSAPSVATTVSVSGGGGSGSIAVTVPTLRLTSKKSPRTNVSVVGYVTELNGETHYRWTSVTSPTANDPTADTVALSTITSVATIASNEILYSTGGVLEHFAPPACSSIAVFQNRLFLAGLEQENEVWFSKEFRTGEAVAFNDELKQTVEPTGGGVNAVAKLEDKVLYFKAERFYYSYGDGPNNTGQGGAFAEPTLAPDDIGTANGQGIVKMPLGLMVKSAKGIRLIGPGLSEVKDAEGLYIGAGVEDFNDLTVTSAVLVSDQNQVRFTTEDGPALVYDYEFGQWSTFTAHEAKGAVMWGTTYVLLKTSGTIWKEDPSYFKDAGSPIRMRIGTGWIALGSLLGFQRIYKLGLAGEYKSSHKLRVKIGYDGSPAYSDWVFFEPDTALDISRYGDGTPYGSDSVFGGVNSAYRFTAAPRIQKCQAIRFLIEELTTSATSGTQEAFTISLMALLAGVKAGLGKFRSKQNLGTE